MMARSDSNDSSEDSTRRREKKRSKSSKKKSKRREDDRKRKKKEKKRRRDHHHHHRSSGSEVDEDSYKRKKRHKKEHKKDRKKRKRQERREDNEESPLTLERNYVLADSLCSLLETHPALAADLPIMLIRLAGGTTFDLTQMTDAGASNGLAKVFASLKSFGVEQDDVNGSWMWKGPPGSSSSGPSNELLLIRVIRAMLDEIGVTSEAVEDYEMSKDQKQPPVEEPTCKEVKDRDSSSVELLLVEELLNEFREGQLANELANLCNMILEGESIALDSLPNERLREGLERLFLACGLEKSEMEEDEEASDNDEDASDEPTMGYGLPEMSVDVSRTKVTSVLNVCLGKQSAVATNTKQARRAIQGPMKQPEAYEQDTAAAVPKDDLDDDDDDDDEEGPAPLGAAKQVVKGPALPPEMVRAKAAQRAREFENVKSGNMQPYLPGQDGESGAVREEWMLVPGKFDFLASIKTGQSIRSRKFEAKSSSQAGGGAAAAEAQPIDASIQAEMDAIMQAHEESRGPSLMELHRQKKAEEAKQGDGSKKSWKWNRDNDLDAGRRVDKNALNMILGGASSDLKKKFHGGFG